MRIVLFVGAMWLSSLPLSHAQHSAVSTPGPGSGVPASSNQVAVGSKVFAASCSVGYCHGLEGRAGKGPRLRDRVWSRAYLYKTVEKGIPNSSMPAWEGRLSEENIHAVVAYVLSISHEENTPSTAAEVAKAQTVEPAMDQNAVAGKALFFDPLKDPNCGTCHRVGGSGTSVGPELHTSAQQSNQELLQAIVNRPAKAALVRWKLRDSDAVCGVKVDATHIYDLGGEGPPVLRTLPDAAVIDGETACSDINVHGANSRNYSAAELQSVVAFLKTVQ